MERRIKLAITLIAFFADMWVWNSRVGSLTNQILFVITFITTPLIWGVVMDAREEAGGLPDNRASKLSSIRRMTPQLIILVLVVLLIISEVISHLVTGSPWINTIYMVVLVSFIGFLWNLVIRDLGIGD